MGGSNMQSQNTCNNQPKKLYLLVRDFSTFLQIPPLSLAKSFGKK